MKIDGWKMYSLLKWSLFRGHVSFQGCNPSTDEPLLLGPSVHLEVHIPRFRPKFSQQKNVVVAWSGSKEKVEVIGSFPQNMGQNPFKNTFIARLRLIFKKNISNWIIFSSYIRVKKSNMLKNQHRPSSCWPFHSDVF